MRRVPYLVDTHLLLWMAADSPRLSAATKELITDPRQEIYFSVASLWEIVIKSSRPKNGFEVDAAGIRRGAIAIDVRELPVHAPHVLAVAELPPLHADPFDRLLLAQATSEDLTLLTVDEQLLRYGSPAERA